MGDVIPLFEEIYSFASSIGLSWDSGTGAKHPAFLARIGKKTLFRIVLLKMYTNDCRAIAEFGIINISKLLNEKQDKEEVRSRLINFPVNKEKIEKEYLSGPDQVEYIDICALKNPENMKYFLETIQYLTEEIKRENPIL